MFSDYWRKTHTKPDDALRRKRAPSMEFQFRQAARAKRVLSHKTKRANVQPRARDPNCAKFKRQN